MVLLVLDPMKLCANALHLVCKGALLTSESLCNLAIRNFWIVETHLDDTVSIRVKFAETSNEMFQKIMIRDNGFNGRPIIRNIIREGAFTVWKWIIERYGVRSMVFTEITLTVTLP